MRKLAGGILLIRKTAGITLGEISIGVVGIFLGLAHAVFGQKYFA